MTQIHVSTGRTAPPAPYNAQLLPQRQTFREHFEAGVQVLCIFTIEQEATVRLQQQGE